MAQQQRATSINSPLLGGASAVTFSAGYGSHRGDSIGDSFSDDAALPVVVSSGGGGGAQSTRGGDHQDRAHAECVLRERGKTLGTKQLGTWFVPISICFFSVTPASLLHVLIMFYPQRHNRLSIIFIVNQIYGPGVLAIPLVYQQAGWFSTLLVLAFFFVASCFASTMVWALHCMIALCHMQWSALF
jgi:hypothetical protein